MTDFILAGLSAGVFAFLTFFIVSFVTLGVITGAIHLVTKAYRSLLFTKTHTYQEQAA